MKIFQNVNFKQKMGGQWANESAKIEVGARMEYKNICDRIGDSWLYFRFRAFDFHRLRFKKKDHVVKIQRFFWMHGKIVETTGILQ